ncbi:MAG: hypothetical protein WD017_02825, partial [Cucumibacter sp.]
PGTGEPTGLVLKCVSPQDAAAAPARRMFIDRQQRKKGATEQDAIEFMAALVQGWEWGGESNWRGDQLAFTPANVRTVLAEPWVRTQVDEALGDNATFFTK